MPSLREASLRHAMYHLKLVRDRLRDLPRSEADWDELEIHLPQVRSAWGWLQGNGDDPSTKDLLVAYGELAWELLDVTRDRLSKLLAAAVEAGAAGRSEGLNRQIMNKLDEILRAQERIQSALPGIAVRGDRNVMAANIVNSSVYTGDLFVTTSDFTTRYERRLNDACEVGAQPPCDASAIRKK